jgi:fructokinase
MIVSCGEALIDFVPQKGNSLQYAPCPGGSPYNLAIASARLGAPTGFLGKISRDFFGDMLHDRLVAEGVDTAFTRRSDRLSTLAFVKIEDGEEPRYAFYTENTADRNLVPVDIPETLPDSVKCLEFGSISLLLEPQASTIKSLIRRESGKRAISFDPNVRPMMVTDKAAYVAEMEELAGLSTIVKVSSADLEWLYPGRPAMESASDWLARGAGIVVMTRGKDGAIIIGPSYRVETPEYWVEVKDTIGAGDTFHAALLVRLHQLDRLSARTASDLTKDEAQDVVEFAVKASSLNCAKQGADPPTAAEMAAAK